MAAPIPQRLLRAALAGLVAVSMSAAAASPEEDYKEGAKSYAAGDVMTAMPRLKSAADAGHAAAQALYALIMDRADSDDEAVPYYRKAAELGNADGQFGYGSALAAGEGVPRNLEEARLWITRAAEQGHPQAINELALAHIRGDLGIGEDARNSPEALRWIRPAADSGFIPAMEALGRAYRSGAYGLAPDAAKAEEWETQVLKARGLLGKRKKGVKK